MPYNITSFHMISINNIKYSSYYNVAFYMMYFERQKKMSSMK